MVYGTRGKPRLAVTEGIRIRVAALQRRYAGVVRDYRLSVVTWDQHALQFTYTIQNTNATTACLISFHEAIF